MSGATCQHKALERVGAASRRRALDGSTATSSLRGAFRARRAQRARRALATPVRASAGGALFEEDGTKGESTAPLGEELTVPTTCMAQLSGSGGATMQKSKLNLTQEVRISQPKTDDAGGGGDIGNRIFNGGGGDGDDSDDDEYQDDFGDDEEEDAKVGLFDIREAIPEVFDMATMECILAEWGKTIVSLPQGLKMLVELGILSGSQLTRWLSLDYRPQLARTVARKAPQGVSRAFVGRVLADPSFLPKFWLEQGLTLATVLGQLKLDGEKVSREKAAGRVVTSCLATGLMVWGLAPSRGLKMPTNIFEPCGPMRRYTMVQRGQSFLLATALTGGLGLGVGALGGAGGVKSQLLQSQLQHVRLQGLGAETWVAQRCSHLGGALMGTGAVRVVTSAVNFVALAMVQGKGEQLFGKFGKFGGGGGKKKRTKRRSSGRKYSPTSATTATIKARTVV
ncbi:hypothetical protein HOP50_04g34020 [Chloropicon primus]|uniref:Uncharacterized protein n=1 Tax=Chloropicon primus TaxID=1764295 RepID=A0A5B8MMN9_9CHLO|nr:hypothetical protein A3770_04p33930 [Chloropicon primus]UPR00088.1 hypothetical protein HOP50_04g34020 [Chloropicon primus]|mmetsp:Transcript_4125/g.11990  ORF Transcript_4125/g.11990 Transcript_4125/m.11990 type:complete len:453 (+) Transcript_4125:288-1646(+)|eukprot:QDZ20875.1 hypothetical protein A3770_04p33930 [Chloropicon primus]